MVKDPEIKAMEDIAQTLEPLDPTVRGRVLQWVRGRFQGATPPDEPEHAADDGAQDSHFDDVMSLYDAANPTSDTERALVGGYWLQVCEDGGDFGSQTVNTALKNLGHGVKNITTAFDGLSQKSPALVRQVQKSGSTKQARKKYRVTAAGIKEVQRLLGGGDGS